MNAVKTSRQEKAAATRRRVVAAAYAMFCDFGYRATTMAAIAERADVAVQTVYFTFHTKDDLLQEVLNRAVLGDNPKSPRQQGWFSEVVAEPDARRAIALIVEATAVILARVAPMMPVFHAAAAEPAGAVFRKGEERRRRDLRDLAEMILRKAGTTGNTTTEEAADLFYVLLGPEIYRSFVVDLEWSRQAWVDWTTRALVRDLRGIDDRSS